jgi:uncharacterized protein
VLATAPTDARGQVLDLRAITALLADVLTEFHPYEIRLFGSRARGDFTAGSDWDIFVVVPNDLAAADDVFAGYRIRRKNQVRADIVLCTLEEFREDRDTPNTLSYEAAHHGVVIYER